MENLTVYEMVIGISIMIILSYGFNTLAKKTNIPSVLMLIIAGFGLSVFLKTDSISLQPVLEVLGTVGLIMIVLEAALDLHIEKNKGLLLTKAFFAALVILIVTAFLLALLFIFTFEVAFGIAILYAIPLSIISSAIIIPSVGGLGDYMKEYLIVESAFSDILGIMAFYFLIDVNNMETGKEIGLHIALNIGITLLFAIVLGYAVTLLLDRFTGEVKLFLPIATLLLLYAIGKLFHLSSLIFVLAFGLMINNKHLFFRGKLGQIISHQKMDNMLKDLKVVTLESSFVIRTFFFVIFGMSIKLGDLNDLYVFLIGFTVVAIIYSVRFLYLSVFDKKNVFPSIAIAPRGLITVLLFYSIPAVLKIEGFQPGILLLAIISSNFIMTYGLVKGKKDDNKETVDEKNEQPEENEEKRVEEETANDSSEEDVETTTALSEAKIEEEEEK